MAPKETPRQRKDRLAKISAERRARESPLARRIRLAKRAQSQAVFRSTQTKRQKERTIAVNAQRKALLRSMETPQQREQMRASNARRKAAIRDRETPHQREHRLAAQAYRQAALRYRLTEQQREQMRAANAQRKAAIRDRETPQQREQRLAAQAYRQAAMRYRQTEQQKEQMRAANAQRKAAIRDRETPQQREQRLAAQAHRQAALRDRQRERMLVAHAHRQIERVLAENARRNTTGQEVTTEQQKYHFVTESLLSINATALSNESSVMERIFNKSANFEQKNPSFSSKQANIGITTTKNEEPPINFALKNMVDIITPQDQHALYNFVIKKEVNLEGAESLVPSERTTMNAMSVYEADPFIEFDSNEPSCERASWCPSSTAVQRQFNGLNKANPLKRKQERSLKFRALQEALENAVFERESNAESLTSIPLNNIFDVNRGHQTSNQLHELERVIVNSPTQSSNSQSDDPWNTETFRSIPTKIINAANLSNDEALIEGMFSKPADFEMAQPPISSKSAKIAIEDEEPILNFGIKNEVEDQDPLLNFVIKKEVDLKEAQSSVASERTTMNAISVCEAKYLKEIVCKQEPVCDEQSLVPTTSAILSAENYSRCANKDRTPVPEIPTDLAVAIKKEPIESEKAEKPILDESEVLGTAWSCEYKQLPDQQKIIVKKAFADIFYEARLGALECNSVHINCDCSSKS